MKPVITPEDRLRSIDELDRDILNLDARINTDTFKLLMLIRLFGERAGCLQCGFDNCAEWLTWRCDLNMSAAREKVRVFPGCHHKRFVDAHHVKHWSAGGETSLDNLMLLCSHHHQLVHEGGFRIERDYQNRWFFKRPDGRVVPSCGHRVQDKIDERIDYIGNNIDNLSFVVNYPSAEGLLNGMKPFHIHSPPP
jgi:hypothetical protein